MGESLKKILSTVLNVLLWVIILLAALFSFVTLATRDPNQVSSVFGYTPMSVQTDSMSPTFEAGDLIIIKKCDPAQLQVGDIVTFHTIIENQYVLNTHRIVAIEESGDYRFFTTKGDNNPIEDSDTITGGDIVGTYVTRIPYLGKVMDFLQSSTGFLVVILLPMLAFFIYQVYNLIMVAMKYKKAVALEEEEEKARIQAEALVKAQAEAAAATAGAEATTETAPETGTPSAAPAEDSISETERLKRELEEAKRRLAEAQAAADAKAQEAKAAEETPETKAPEA